MEEFLATIIVLVLMTIILFIIYNYKPTVQTISRDRLYQRQYQTYQNIGAYNTEISPSKEIEEPIPDHYINHFPLNKPKSSQISALQEEYASQISHPIQSDSCKTSNLNINQLKNISVRIKPKYNKHFSQSYDVQRKKINQKGEKIQQLYEKMESKQEIQNRPSQGTLTFSQKLYSLAQTPITPVHQYLPIKPFLDPITPKTRKFQIFSNIEQNSGNVFLKKPDNTIKEKILKQNQGQMLQPKPIQKTKEQKVPTITKITPNIFKSQNSFGQQQQKPTLISSSYQSSITKPISNPFMNFQTNSTLFGKFPSLSVENGLFKQKLDESGKPAGLLQQPLNQQIKKPQEEKKENPSLNFTTIQKIGELNSTIQTDLFKNPPKISQSSSNLFPWTSNPQKQKITVQQKPAENLVVQPKITPFSNPPKIQSQPKSLFNIGTIEKSDKINQPTMSSSSFKFPQQKPLFQKQNPTNSSLSQDPPGQNIQKTIFPKLAQVTTDKPIFGGSNFPNQIVFPFQNQINKQTSSSLLGDSSGTSLLSSNVPKSSLNSTERSIIGSSNLFGINSNPAVISSESQINQPFKPSLFSAGIVPSKQSKTPAFPTKPLEGSIFFNNQQQTYPKKQIIYDFFQAYQISSQNLNQNLTGF